MLINKPTKQISALVRKEYGRKKERSVEGYYASRVIIPSRELLECIKVVILMQMNKKEKVISEFEMDLKKSFCWRYKLSNDEIIS